MGVELLQLLLRNRDYHIEFKDVYSNTLAPNLISRCLLGATKGELEEHLESYIQAEPLEPWIASQSFVTPDNWKSFLGQKQYYADYVEMFDKEIRNFGISGSIRRYFPLLCDGISGANLHPLIHLGFGLAIKSKQVVSEGLAYLCYAYQFIATIQPSEGINFQERSSILLFQQIERNPLFENVFDSNAIPFKERFRVVLNECGVNLIEYANQWDMQPIDHQISNAAIVLAHNLVRMLNVSGSIDYYIIHLVIGICALKYILPELNDGERVTVLRNFFLVTLVYYVCQNRPVLSSAPHYSQAKWDWIIANGRSQLVDDHISMLIWACKQYEFQWGPDPLFRSTAAITLTKVKSSADFMY